MNQGQIQESKGGTALKTAIYTWGDLDMDHGYHASKQGERYTLGESARRTVFDRLFAPTTSATPKRPKPALYGKGTKKRKAKEAKTEAAASQGALIKPPQQELSL